MAKGTPHGSGIARETVASSLPGVSQAGEHRIAAG